jgi:hypothetical protein
MALILNALCLRQLGHHVHALTHSCTVAAIAHDVPEAKCCVLIDPWWPAIPKATRIAIAERACCPMLVFGSSAFNRPREDGKGLFCEGTSEGLQDSMMGAYASANGSSLLVVPNQSHHTMVDDLGAIFKDKCAPASNWRLAHM